MTNTEESRWTDGDEVLWMGDLEEIVYKRRDGAWEARLAPFRRELRGWPVSDERISEGVDGKLDVRCVVITKQSKQDPEIIPSTENGYEIWRYNSVTGLSLQSTFVREEQTWAFADIYPGLIYFFKPIGDHTSVKTLETVKHITWLLDETPICVDPDRAVLAVHRRFTGDNGKLCTKCHVVLEEINERNLR